MQVDELGVHVVLAELTLVVEHDVGVGEAVAGVRVPRHGGVASVGVDRAQVVLIGPVVVFDQRVGIDLEVERRDVFARRGAVEDFERELSRDGKPLGDEVQLLLEVERSHRSRPEPGIDSLCQRSVGVGVHIGLGTARFIAEGDVVHLAGLREFHGELRR